MFSKFLIYSMLLFQITCEPDRRIITTLNYSKYYVKPTIVNGEPAVTGQVPYLVSIKEPIRKFSEGRIVWKNLCGGSIIDELKVLTAAHCFESNNFYYGRNPQVLRVVAGNLRTDLTHSGDTETNIINQWRQISKVVLHKHFHFPKNDIAIIFVTEPWKFRSNVDYITPAKRSTDYKSCMSAGFGRMGYSLSHKVSPVLLVARINTLSKWQCSRIWEMNMNTYICSDSSLTDVSRGDSGGPLVCKNTLDPGEEPGRDLLVGVVSGKNFDKTTLYTRVSAYYDWIDRNESANVVGCVCLVINVILFLIIYLMSHFFTPLFTLWANENSLKQ